MPWIDYREVRRRIPMSRVLELLGWEPHTRRGDELRGPCPIHVRGTFPVQGGDTRPLFAVHLGKQVYFCHKCQSGGDQLKLWQVIQQRPLYPATLALCQAAGIEPPWLNPLDIRARCTPQPKRSSRNL
jgi:DNA primase